MFLACDTSSHESQLQPRLLYCRWGLCRQGLSLSQDATQLPQPYQCLANIKMAGLNFSCWIITEYFSAASLRRTAATPPPINTRGRGSRFGQKYLVGMLNHSHYLLN